MNGDQKCDCACHWNWGWLTPAFVGTKISPSDIDCVIERRGHCLFIEAKRLNEALTTGQRILIEHLSRKQNCLAVVVYGSRDTPEIFDVCESGDWIVTRCPTNQTDFFNRVARWFEKANSF